MSQSETLAIKLDGKNYFSWEFQFCMFVKGKDLWGYVDGSESRPQEAIDIVKIKEWDSNDAKIISWILSSVDARIVLSLRPFRCSKDMWNYLK